MEVDGRSFSFLFMGDGCRFQPLIFQGVTAGDGGTNMDVMEKSRVQKWLAT